MVFFKNTIMELWEYAEDSEIDVYGEQEVKYEFVGEYSCDFQAKNMNENSLNIGEIKTDTYDVFFNINTPLTNSMILRCKGAVDTYEIIGGIEVWNNLIPHLRCTVQKERKPTKLER